MSAVLTRTSTQPKALKQRKCKVCRGLFAPRSMGHTACSQPCAEEVATAKREQQERKERRARDRARLEDVRQTREKLEAMKALPTLKAEAEKAMNAWVRWRDRPLGCISCGQPFPIGRIGGDFDAGHFRSKGSAAHLRFDPRNVHGQCKHCNDRLAGNPTGYERGLVARIGADEVEALKRDETPRKHSRDDCRALRDMYRAKLNQAKREAK